MKKEDLRHDFPYFIVRSLEKSWHIYLANLNACRERFSEKAVHDLRVSIRRLLAFVMLIDEIMPNPYSHRLLKALKKQLKMFNPLRDTQVQIIVLKDLVYTFPVVYTYYNHLLKNEVILIDNLRQTTGRFSETEIQGNVLFLKMYIKGLLRNPETGFDSLFDYSFRRFNDVLDSLLAVDTTDLSTVHRLRLSFKKFRYVTEFLQPVIYLTRQDIKNLKKFQTLLGNIQDNRVFYDSLKSFIAAQEEIAPELFGPVLDDLITKRQALMESFRAQSALVPSLWREEMFIPRSEESSER